MRTERQKQGLSLEELAARADLTWSYISQVERSLRNITIDNMDRLAGGLNVELSDLLKPLSQAKREDSE